METPLVAVWMLTYNHEKFIAQALDSVLKQKTKFPFKIFLGEDCSADRTRNICIAYSEKYPDKIELFLNATNDVQKNGNTIWGACFASGAKYMAILEGDDYWTDPDKLQKQFDFLESNADYGLVHTAYRIAFSEGSTLSVDHSRMIPSGNVFLPLLLRNFIATVTIMVRTDLALSALKRRSDLQSRTTAMLGDYLLWLSISMETKIGYIETETAAYRVLPGSITHPKTLRKFLSLQQAGFDIVKTFAVFLPDNDRQRVILQKKTEFQTTVFKAILEDTSIINEYKTLLDDFIPGRPGVKLVYCVVVFCRYNRIVIRTIAFLLRLLGARDIGWKT